MFFDKPILSIETSCDETSASVVVGHKVKSNVIASQIEMHKKWGGIVPEAAARAHVEAALPTIDEALAVAGVGLTDIEGFAVTHRPGLVGALSVGLTVAKSLAFALRKPLVGVDHLEGHLLAFLSSFPDAVFPVLSLLVSGGHTEIVLILAPGEYKLIGSTRDDAAGEAFDKGARLLGLGYPGGYQIQIQAAQGNPSRYALPRGLEKETFDMSFSGLKTAVLRLVEKEGDGIDVPDAAASLQRAITDVLVTRMENAIAEFRPAGLSLCGGVAANQELRTRLEKLATKESIPWMPAPMELCTDNAGMIGIAGSIRLAMGERADHALEVQPNSLLFAH